MPRFIITRTLGDVGDDQLEAAAAESSRVREELFPEITWEHSHVVRTAEGLTSYCVYGAPSEESVRDHAAAAGLPVDSVAVIERDLVP